MNSRIPGFLCLIVMLLTVIWAVLLALYLRAVPASAALAGRVAAIEAQFPLFLLVYSVAILITLSTVTMLASFYACLRTEAPLWAAIGFVFVPIYGLANLGVYGSQLFVVPGLLAAFHNPGTAPAAGFLLAMTIHDWPGSAVGLFNALAYSVLGITSMIFGLLLARRHGMLGVGGWLLALSGLLLVIALIGTVAGDARLAAATFISAGLYLIALLLIAPAFLLKRSKGMPVSLSGEPLPAPRDPALMS